MMQARSFAFTSALDTQKKAAGEEALIQAYVSDPASEHILREVLDEFQPDNFKLYTLNCAQATARLSRGATPKILIIDVAGEDQPLTSLSELANILEPDVRVLVIGDRQDANFYRQMTRGLGVAEYLYKPLNRSMVARFFGPFLGEMDYQPDAARGGRVLGFLSARGGAGATTIAANLAWYLGEVSRRHTLILDSDFYSGSVAVLLGTKTDGGLRAAFESPQRVDELFVERSAQRVGERCDVLSSQVDLSESVMVSPNGPSHLISVVKRKYNYIVVDVPGFTGDVNKEILQCCEQKVIVLDPSLPALRDTLRILASQRSNTQGVRPLVVLNKLGKPGTLSLAEISGALGREPDVVIPFLPKIVSEAEISGEPVASHRSQFSASIEKLAHEAASVSIEGAASETGLLHRLVSGISGRFMKK